MAGEMNTSNTKYWLMIIAEAMLFLFIMTMMNRCNSEKVDVLETNIIGYRDSLKTVELKNGELISYKQSLILNNEALREELNISKTEIKDLEKKLDSKIAQVNKLSSMLQMKDTVFMKSDTVYINSDSTSTKIFKWSDNWTELTANVTGASIIESNLALYDFRVKVPLEFGITEDYKVWAKSPNPYLVIEDISSATVYGSTIYPKKKRWSWGLQVGFGAGYDVISKRFVVGPYAGAGVEYNF
jgi:hypothetical protein